MNNTCDLQKEQINTIINESLKYKEIFKDSTLTNSDLLSKGLALEKIVQLYRDAIKNRTEIDLSNF